ncbi:CdaR family transcriptional regulator [Nonomuraea basaltis]|uniref:CdaR family transcriptional regulator n=1 Tax=Nonomuraea basaltis TaxID=2495887 RepID=UPI00110C5FD1|nr:sugar diacid recognition domain-containing protein [Nonomuraea basaltis]TMR98637.1 sugar diacid utilization regulator [Nonomuraea basaltis]
MLTPLIAQEIARETSTIIGFNVLITDREGIVIGSGDTDRLGTFHEASVDVMRTLRSASHGTEAAYRLIGVQPGITLPILLNDESVGTVGITGDPDQVERFGRVVRNQTEILLRESLLQRSLLLRESAIEDVLRDLAHFDPEITEPDLIAFKAHELGYDFRLSRSVVVMDIDAPKEAHSPSEPGSFRAAMLRALRRTFPDPRDLVGSIAPGRFVVLRYLAMPYGEAPLTDLLTRCRGMADDLVRPHGVACRIGVGGIAASVAELHDSYRDATNALYLMNRLGRSEHVTHIADVRVHDLLATVAHGARARFAQALLGPLRQQPGWELTRKTITAWCESGFNLVQASSALHIHRNTLVYRLNKIEALLGPSFRDARTCLSVYLACLIDELEGSAAD